MENNKSNTGLKVGLGIALVLFLATGFYTMNLYNSSKKVQTELTEEKQLVMNDLNAMAKQYDEAIGENEVSNANLIEARSRIQGLIDFLNTVGLKGFGVIERTSGKLIPTERASRVDKIRVCFTVAKNTLVQAGDEELYVQVIDPKNNTLGLNESYCLCNE